jgi:hypothetical protein
MNIEDQEEIREAVINFLHSDQCRDQIREICQAQDAQWEMTERVLIADLVKKYLHSDEGKARINEITIQWMTAG